MSESSRTAPAEAPVSDADREALIERLLLAGLDHYFDGKYEQAVNVWTRVVFLERGHGRARAYIERARGAIAERQRHAEELLHRGVEAYEGGDLPLARDLLTSAVAEGGANETALVFLQRLGRLQIPDAGVLPSATAIAAAPEPSSRGVAHQRAVRPLVPAATGETTSWFITILLSAGIAAAILLIAQPVASWLGDLPVAAPPIESRRDEPLPIVRASEAAIARAHELHQNGRLRDALRLLQQVDIGDPLRPDADRLRADIQNDLLVTAGDGQSTSQGPRR